VALLETEVERKKQRSEELETRLTSLEKDYENYKVRAQSVLRQAKDKVRMNSGYLSTVSVNDLE
jgi:hypothetical protein